VQAFVALMTSMIKQPDLKSAFGQTLYKRYTQGCSGCQLEKTGQSHATFVHVHVHEHEHELGRPSRLSHLTAAINVSPATIVRVTVNVNRMNPSRRK
jgi:hypothetical protein